MLFARPLNFKEWNPMSVDQTTVKRVARLARLKVKEEDVPRARGRAQRHPRLDRAAERGRYVDGVEPMTSVVTMKMKMREDEVTDGHYPQKSLANAPAQEDAFFMVPKVVE